MTSVIALDRKDADAMAVLHAAAFPVGEAWTASAFKDLFNQPATLARGVRGDDALVAFVMVQFVKGEAEILTLATAPQAQRRGHARALIEALEQELRTVDLKKWLLDVRSDNSGAMAFYKTLGFHKDGTRRNYYKRLEGGRIDAILMSKAVAGQTGQ